MRHKEKLRQGARQARFDILLPPLTQLCASGTWQNLRLLSPQNHSSEWPVTEDSSFPWLGRTQTNK